MLSGKEKSKDNIRECTNTLGFEATGFVDETERKENCPWFCGWVGARV